MAETAKLDPSQEDTSPNGKVEWLDPSDESQLRQFILQADDRPEELIQVKLWRVEVLVRAMNGTQRALYESNPRDKAGRFTNLRHVYFEVVRMCCVHPRTYKPFFQAADEGIVMEEKNGDILDFLASKAVRLSGILPSQTEHVRRKNSESTPTSTTTTESPSDSDTSQ